MKKELFSVVHYRYDYYGKEDGIVTADLVYSTERQVKKAVDLLNKLNRSYYASYPEPDEEWDESCRDEDYFYYKKAELCTPVEVIKKRTYKYR